MVDRVEIDIMEVIRQTTDRIEVIVEVVHHAGVVEVVEEAVEEAVEEVVHIVVATLIKCA
jgi:hypothetical protein